MRRSRAGILLLGFFCMIMFAGGCYRGLAQSGEATMTQWQEAVDQYIQHHGQGHPVVLRSSENSTIPTISVLGGKSADRSTDVVGLFLGLANDSGLLEHTPRLIFLVARVSRNRVVEIRPVIRTEKSQSVEWNVGENNSQSLTLYNQTHPTSTPPIFPARTAVFRFVQEEKLLILTESKSGARWSIAVESLK